MIKDTYFESVTSIERLHRLFLEVIRIDLDNMGIFDINNVQSLVLYNLGKGQTSVTELTNRGYYLGSNVSYNLRKMIQNGYIEQEPSPHDKRSTLVRLAPKGLELHRKLEVTFTKHVEGLAGVGIEDVTLENGLQLLRRLEILWTKSINFQR